MLPPHFIIIHPSNPINNSHFTTSIINNHHQLSPSTLPLSPILYQKILFYRHIKVLKCARYQSPPSRVSTYSSLVLASKQGLIIFVYLSFHNNHVTILKGRYLQPFNEHPLFSDR